MKNFLFSVVAASVVLGSSVACAQTNPILIDASSMSRVLTWSTGDLSMGFFHINGQGKIYVCVVPEDVKVKGYTSNNQCSYVQNDVLMTIPKTALEDVKVPNMKLKAYEIRDSGRAHYTLYAYYGPATKQSK